MSCEQNDCACGGVELSRLQLEQLAALAKAGAEMVIKRRFDRHKANLVKMLLQNGESSLSIFLSWIKFQPHARTLDEADEIATKMAKEARELQDYDAKWILDLANKWQALSTKMTTFSVLTLDIADFNELCAWAADTWSDFR